jgi:hypothetical protein
MLTKNVFLSPTLATLATLAATTCVVETSAITPVCSCPKILNEAGETHCLTADPRVSGSCLVVAADRVTIDFKDHSITGDGSGAAVTDGGVARPLLAVTDGTADSFDTGIDLAPTSRSEVRGMVRSCRVGHGGAI